MNIIYRQTAAGNKYIVGFHTSFDEFLEMLLRREDLELVSKNPQVSSAQVKHLFSGEDTYFAVTLQNTSQDNLNVKVSHFHFD